MTVSDDELCHCGLPLHYSDPAVRDQVDQLIAATGQRYLRVSTPDGTFLVDKHYVALHGVKGPELPYLGFLREPDS